MTEFNEVEVSRRNLAASTGIGIIGALGLAKETNSKANDRKRSHSISVFDFMTEIEISDARGITNTRSDHTTSIQKALDAAYALQTSLFFPDAVFLCFGTVISNINFIQIGLFGFHAKIVSTSNSPALVLAPYTSDFAYFYLSKNSNIGTFFVTAPGHNINVGDNLHISSEDVGETSWGYKRYGSYVAVAVNGDEITVDRPLRFSFTTSASSKIFKNAQNSFINIEGIEFIKQGDSSISGNVCSIRYANKVIINNCAAGGEENPKYADGIAIDQCDNITINVFHGYACRYPLNIQRGRNAHISNITGSGVRHLVDFNSFFETGIVTNFSGVTREGGVNCHPAFDIHYINGTTTDISQCSNHRAIGGSIQNVSINLGSNCGSHGMYFGISLSEPLLIDDLASFGLKLFVSNLTVIDARIASGSGIASIYGGVYEKIYYKKFNKKIYMILPSKHL